LRCTSATFFRANNSIVDALMGDDGWTFGLNDVFTKTKYRAEGKQGVIN